MERAVNQKVEERSTREHLILIGADLIHRHGYGATGLKEILDAARVPKGSFYHYFNSKEEFAAAVIEHYAMKESLRWQTILSDPKRTPLKRLRFYFEDLICIFGSKGPSPGCPIGHLTLEVSGQSVLLQKLLSNAFTYWQQAFVDILQEAIEKKELRKNTNASSLAAFVLNSWEGALLRSIADKSDEPLQIFLDYTFDVLLVK